MKAQIKIVISCQRTLFIVFSRFASKFWIRRHCVWLNRNPLITQQIWLAFYWHNTTTSDSNIYRTDNTNRKASSVLIRPVTSEGDACFFLSQQMRRLFRCCRRLNIDSLSANKIIWRGEDKKSPAVGNRTIYFWVNARAWGSKFRTFSALFSLIEHVRLACSF